MQHDGLDGALIALSSPLGIESLPTGEAEPLLDAYHEGVQALGAPFGWWGAVALDRPVPDAVDRLLAAGATGISMPAGALASPRGLDRVGPLLERVERHGAPLFVHPGPAPWRPMAWTGSTFPGWWPALTAYVTQQHEAWHAWMAWGRAQHPLLTVVWAMLAGGAPLHAERLATRGGPDGRTCSRSTTSPRTGSARSTRWRPRSARTGSSTARTGRWSGRRSFRTG